MLLQQPRNISEAIIQLFREKQEYTAAELLALARDKYGDYSQRALYKQLRDLIERGVVIRSEKRYSLSLTWILSLIRLGEDLYNTIVAQELKSDYLPVVGKRNRWRFEDLQHLDRFWIQMIFLLFENSLSRKMYVWVPYFWFDLIHYQKDLEAQEAMKVAGNKMYMILGDDCYLTRLPERYWSTDAYEWSYAPGPFAKLQNIYYDVIDDYVMTIELTTKTTNQIRDLFNDVKGPQDLDQISRFEQIKSNSPSSLTIERNKQKAQKLRKKFQRYFGL